MASPMYIDREYSEEHNEDVYMLPVRVTNKVITVWVDDNYSRYFTRDNAPEFLKQRLAMIGACDNAHLRKDDMNLSGANNHLVNRIFLKGLYMQSRNEAPEEYDHIGWRVNNKYYYVVVPESIVDEWKRGRAR